MNRRQKIIVSVVGIFIVLLALVGITYGYFLTRIQGNTNTKSISVTTADLKLVYDGDNGNIIGGELLEPQEVGTEPFTKTFTVYNDGNVNIDYGVYLIDVINTFERKDDIKYRMECTTNGTEPCGKVETATTFPSGISELVTATIEPEKTHTYTFKFTYYDTGSDQSVDMNKELRAKIQIFTENPDGNYYPYEEGTLAYNIINNSLTNKNGTTYIETVSDVGVEYGSGRTYKELVDGDYNIKEDSEMGASVYYTNAPDNWENTIQPYGEFTQNNCNNRIGQYLVNVGTSSSSEYNMVIDSMTPKEILRCEEIDGKYYPVVNGSKFVEKTEGVKLLSKTEDEEGISYYYRGTVTDNYVNFANMCWRIVRVTGNGSVKLILEDKDNLCATSNGNWEYDSGNFGSAVSTYGYYRFDYLNYEGGMADAFQTFQTTELNDYLDRLIVPNWYWNDQNIDGTAYETYYRLDSVYNGTGEVAPYMVGRRDWTEFRDGTPMYVGALTADEMVFAGAKYNSGIAATNIFSYLIDSNVTTFYSISPGVYTGNDNIFILNGQGLSVGALGYANSAYRPVIALKPGIKIKSDDGMGTKTKPYVVE